MRNHRMIIGNGAEAAVTGVIGEEPRGDLEKKKIIKWVFKLLYAGFETCFGPRAHHSGIYYPYHGPFL